MLPKVYEEFNTTDTSKFRNINEPIEDQSAKDLLQSALNQIGGMRNGKPNLRVVWGAAQEFYYVPDADDSDIAEGYYKKYFLAFVPAKITAWQYVSAIDGEIKIVEREDLAPSYALLSPVVPNRDSIGVPRWTIEKLWADGEYRHFFTLERISLGEDSDGAECRFSQYLKPDLRHAQYIEELWHNAELPEDERMRRLEERFAEEEANRRAETADRTQELAETILKTLRDEHISMADLDNLPRMNQVKPADVLSAAQKGH